MHIALSSLIDYSFSLLLALIGLLSVDILHIKLDIKGIDQLHFFITVRGFVLLEELGHLVFGISEHHRPRKVKNDSKM